MGYRSQAQTSGDFSALPTEHGVKPELMPRPLNHDPQLARTSPATAAARKGERVVDMNTRCLCCTLARDSWMSRRSHPRRARRRNTTQDSLPRAVGDSEPSASFDPK